MSIEYYTHYQTHVDSRAKTLDLKKSSRLTAIPILAFSALCLAGSRCEAMCGSPSVTRPASYAGPFVYLDRIPDILLSSSGSEHKRRFGPMRTREP